MVKAETAKEVASDSGTSRKKSKKVKRKSTFYSLPVHADHEVTEELPAPVPTPLPTSVPVEAEDKSPGSESNVDVTDNVDSVDNYDLNFQIKTRKSESHWYMIYYDGSIDISDDEDSDDLQKPGDSLESALQHSSGCTSSIGIQGDKKKDEMVCAMIFLCVFSVTV